MELLQDELFFDSPRNARSQNRSVIKVREDLRTDMTKRLAKKSHLAIVPLCQQHTYWKRAEIAKTYNYTINCQDWVLKETNRESIDNNCYYFIYP